MANWYNAEFKIKDKDVVNVIKNNCMDFDYDKDNGVGYCRLAYGIISLDLDTIENIAKKNKSSFSIFAYDIYTDTKQSLICEDGDIKVCESKQLDSYWRNITG